MRDMLEEVGATVAVDNFEDLGVLRQLPGVAAQRLMADGYGSLQKAIEDRYAHSHWKCDGLWS